MKTTTRLKATEDDIFMITKTKQSYVASRGEPIVGGTYGSVGCKVELESNEFLEHADSNRGATLQKPWRHPRLHMHHANQATTIHRRPSTTKQSSHPSTFVKPPDFGGHSNVATDRIADAMRYAPAVDYWLRPVLDDGGCQDWTVPSCKWCQAYVPIKSTPSLGGGGSEPSI